MKTKHEIRRELRRLEGYPHPLTVHENGITRILARALNVPSRSLRRWSASESDHVRRSLGIEADNRKAREFHSGQARALAWLRQPSDGARR